MQVLVGGVTTHDVPTAPELFNCQPTSECTFGSDPNRQCLKDRFLTVQACIVDGAFAKESGTPRVIKPSAEETLWQRLVVWVSIASTEAAHTAA